MAPQFEHSAFTPPGAVLLLALRNDAADMFVTVAEGPGAREPEPDLVFTFSIGRAMGVLARSVTNIEFTFDGATVCGTGSGCGGGRRPGGAWRSELLRPGSESSSDSLELSESLVWLADDDEVAEAFEEAGDVDLLPFVLYIAVCWACDCCTSDIRMSWCACAPLSP